jgi:hypothetical protein
MESAANIIAYHREQRHRKRAELEALSGEM